MIKTSEMTRLDLDVLISNKIASIVERCINSKIKQLPDSNNQYTDLKTAQIISNPLTKRETEVLSLISEGLTNPEISKKLFISRSTAKSHVHSILQKLYAKNRAIATKIAIKEGLI